MPNHSVKDYMIAVRPWSFPASAMPVIVTTAYLFWKGETPVNWLAGLWALVNIVIFHAAGNTWSDLFDYRKKVDAEDTFGSKTLTSGMFTEKEIMRLSIILTVTGCIGGIGLLCLTGLPLLWIGLGGLACTLLYPPLKFRALGDLVIILAYAVLPTIGTSYVVTGAIDPGVLWVALPLGLITDGILHCNNTRDISTDRRSGITTMAMGIGFKASAWLYCFEMVFPFVWVVAGIILKAFPVMTIVTVLVCLPAALKCTKSMLKSISAGAGLISNLDERTAKFQLMFSTTLTLMFFCDAILF